MNILNSIFISYLLYFIFSSQVQIYSRNWKLFPFENVRYSVQNDASVHVLCVIITSTFKFYIPCQ